MKNFIFLFLMSLSLSAYAATDCSQVTQIPPAECEALIALYHSTDGSNWSHNYGWNEDNTPCNWHGEPPFSRKGVNCQAGHVISIDLYHENLSGPIPIEIIKNFTFLSFLHLGGNNLSGSIPPEIGDLTSLSDLSFLSLFDNNLSGSIPPEIGNLTSLSSLNLSSNNLSGSIPPEIGDLTSLSDLNLARNNLSGSIPPEIGNLTSLSYLHLNDNNLSGLVPLEIISNLTSLRLLHLGENNLSGSIPSEISNLTSLEFLDLFHNNFSGSIPSEIGNLTLLGLDLSHNNFSGSISEISNLTSLSYYLNLSHNNFSGSISEISNLTFLMSLNLSYNNFSGSIPSEIGNLIYLKELNLSNNELCGSIPLEITNLIFLYEMPQSTSIHQNNLLVDNINSDLEAFLDAVSPFDDWRDQKNPSECQVLLVELDSLAIEPETNNNLIVSWLTGTEQDNVGFRVWIGVVNEDDLTKIIALGGKETHFSERTSEGNLIKLTTSNTSEVADCYPNLECLENQLKAVNISCSADSIGVCSEVVHAKGSNMESTRYSYSYINDFASNNVDTTFYLLESIDANGERTFHWDKLFSLSSDN